MENAHNVDVRIQFGEQLLKYRTVTGLTQREYADYLDVGQNDIVNAETGKHSIGNVIQEKYARSFGVAYYIMANPNIEPPTYDELPEELKAYVEKVKIDRERKKEEPQQKIGVVVDQEIPTFLASPKTALEFVNHLKHLGLTSTSQNVKNLLTSKKRSKIVDVIPAKGEDDDKYVFKPE